MPTRAVDLGNTKPGDGPRYKGRGLIQLTGRANYREYGKAMGVDLEGDPQKAGDPELSLAIACEYWKRRKINPDADRDDIVTVTKKINGGRNGLADRAQYLAKAKAAIARIEGHQVSGAAPRRRPAAFGNAAREARPSKSFRRRCRSSAFPSRSTATSAPPPNWL